VNHFARTSRWKGWLHELHDDMCLTLKQPWQLSKRILLNKASNLELGQPIPNEQREQGISA
jgi:hypothetical protein